MILKCTSFLGYKENYFVLVLNVRNRKIENPQFTVNFIVIEDSNNGNFFVINTNCITVRVPTKPLGKIRDRCDKDIQHISKQSNTRRKIDFFHD